MNKNLYYAAGLLSAALIVIGVKLTSIGVAPSHLMQNDGYNVTGGILTLIGGFIAGVLYKSKSK